MGIFTFTVKCAVTPTPTPTPTSTPCPCDYYQLENIGGISRIISYIDCRGIGRNIPLPSGNLIEICACSVTPQTDILITNISTCAEAPTPTPTPTNTPTPTVTPTPTSTPKPNRTVTVYASIEAIPNTPIPPSNTPETAVRVYWTRGVPMALQLLGGSITSTSCNFLGTITVPQGDRVFIGVRSYSNNTPVFFTLNEGSTSCTPGPESAQYCGTLYDPGGGFSFIVNSDISVGIRGSTKLIYGKDVPTTTSLYYCNS